DIAVRGTADAASILDRQVERTKNPDRKAQLQFVRPAISANAGERDAWFAALADPANRRHEPWVLEGLRYLHHPLRAGASERRIVLSSADDLFRAAGDTRRGMSTPQLRNSTTPN